MRYEVKPVEYTHEVELALKLHLKTLSLEYGRIVKHATPGNYGSHAISKESQKAIDEIKSRMIEVEEGLALFEKRKEEPIYNLEDEIKDFDIETIREKY